MFDSAISNLNNEMSDLQKKLEALQNITKVADNALDSIKNVLDAVESYPQEKQMFIDSIMKVIGVNPISINNSPNVLEVVKETKEDKLDLTTMTKLSERLYKSDNICVIEFDNLRSRNGSNSLKLWEKELIGVFSKLSISNNKLDNGYLMIIENVDNDVVDYLTPLDFTATPEENAVVKEVVETVETKEVPNNNMGELQENESNTEIVETVESEVVKDSDTKDNEYPDVDILESNKRIGKCQLGDTFHIYIGFDNRTAFGDKSSANSWELDINNQYPELQTEIINNWMSGIYGLHLIHITIPASNISVLSELVKYDYTLSPVQAKFHKDGIAGVEKEEPEVKANETIETKEVETVSFDPDEEFTVI